MTSDLPGDVVFEHFAYIVAVVVGVLFDARLGLALKFRQELCDFRIGLPTAEHLHLC